LHASKRVSQGTFARLSDHDPLLAWTSRHQNTRRVLTRSQISDLSLKLNTRPLRQARQHSKRSIQSPQGISMTQRGRHTRCSPESMSIIIRTCSQYTTHNETLYLALSLYSRFLESQYVHTAQQCLTLSMAVSLIAIKFLDDVDVYYSRTLKHLGLDADACMNLLLAMERRVMNVLNWRIYLPSPDCVGWLILSACAPQASLHPICNNLMASVDYIIGRLIRTDGIFVASLGVDTHDLMQYIISRLVSSSCAYTVLSFLIKDVLIHEHVKNCINRHASILNII
jgi:cyclin-like protein